MTKRDVNLENLPSCLEEGRLCAVVNAICPFTDDDKLRLLNVLRFAKRNNAEFYRFYTQRGNPLAKKMLAAPHVNWVKVVEWEYGVIETAKEKGDEAGMMTYFLGVFGMVEAFWPDCEDPLFTSLHARKDADYTTLDTRWTTLPS